MVILEEDHTRFVSILDRLLGEANASMVFLVDKSGQQVAATGDLDGVDSTALASLAAGNVAATEGLAQLIGEDEFCTLYHEGAQGSILVSLVSDRIILLVVFDERSSLGLVRLRVKQRMPELEIVAGEVIQRSGDRSAIGVAAVAIAEISDEDIDALFG